MKALVEVFLRVKGEKEMENLLLGLFTQAEREELDRRLKIVGLLKKGVPQHTIAEKLGVGVATVSRGAQEIKKGHFASI